MIMSFKSTNDASIRKNDHHNKSNKKVIIITTMHQKDALQNAISTSMKSIFSYNISTSTKTRNNATIFCVYRKVKKNDRTTIYIVNLMEDYLGKI